MLSYNTTFSHYSKINYKKNNKTSSHDNKSNQRFRKTFKKSKIRSFSKNVRHNIEEFSSLTTLHGLKYIFEKGKSSGERIFWIFVFIGVLILCAFQTFELIDYWNKGDILLTQETTKLHVWDVPFPAITLCSDNQINATKLEEAKKEINDTETLQDVKDFADIACFTNLFGNFSENYLNEEAIKYAIQNLAQSCKSLIIRIRWINDALPDPCTYLQPVILSTGICYSLNMISFEQLFHSDYNKILSKFSPHKYFFHSKGIQTAWSIETGYLTNNPLTPPWRVGGDGIFDAVKFAVDLRTQDFKHYCGISSSGLTLILHNPIDYPNPSSIQYIRPNIYSLIVIDPQVVITSDTLRSWSPQSRGCVYQHEKPLRFFKIYTLNNCELECRANRTLELCGCVTHYHPRDESTLVCGLSSRTCVSKSASTKFSVFGNKSASELNDFENANCNCLPSCSELTYNAEVTEIVKNWTQMIHVDPTINSTNMAVVNIYFKKKNADFWIRSPMIRFNELIANIGGVMSLCIGCSIISFFEIIYFFILKKWLKKNEKKLITRIQQHNVTPLYIS